MRKTFSKLIQNFIEKEPRAYFLTADLGFRFFDEILQKFPDRCVNVGAAEQLLVGAGIGLALDGKIPICYSITPFLLYRPFELIRNYLDYEKIPVKLIGSGRDKDYIHDGFSHWAEDDKDVMKLFKNIKTFHPDNPSELQDIFEDCMYDKSSCYLNLKR